MRRLRSMRTTRAAYAAALATVLLLGGGTGFAVAGALITSADIQNGSIRGIDVKDGSLRKADFGGNLTGARGPAGPAGTSGEDGSDGAAGPAGATGPAGERGPQGPQGATGQPGQPGTDGGPDEYVSWTVTMRQSDTIDPNRGRIQISTQRISGPAEVLGVSLDIPQATSDWLSNPSNCVYGGYVSVQSTSGVGTAAAVVWTTDADPGAGQGMVVAGESTALEAVLSCTNAQYEQVPVPDLTFTAKFAIDYLDADAPARAIN